jgi:hypothetical protein
MLNFLAVGLAAGVSFAVMDAAINANPPARRLNAVYEPIARKDINVAAGIAIDLSYGLIMTGLFGLLHPVLPGAEGLAKGMAFGLIAWFFRVLMGAASAWMVHRIPLALVLYNLATGLVEMLVVGALIGAFLHVG